MVPQDDTDMDDMTGGSGYSTPTPGTPLNPGRSSGSRRGSSHAHHQPPFQPSATQVSLSSSPAPGDPRSWDHRPNEHFGQPSSPAPGTLDTYNRQHAPLAQGSAPSQSQHHNPPQQLLGHPHHQLPHRQPTPQELHRPQSRPQLHPQAHPQIALTPLEWSQTSDPAQYIAQLQKELREERERNASLAQRGHARTTFSPAPASLHTTSSHPHPYPPLPPPPTASTAHPSAPANLYHAPLPPSPSAGGYPAGQAPNPSVHAYGISYTPAPSAPAHPSRSAQSSPYQAPAPGPVSGYHPGTAPSPAPAHPPVQPITYRPPLVAGPVGGYYPGTAPIDHGLRYSSPLASQSSSRRPSTSSVASRSTASRSTASRASYQTASSAATGSTVTNGNSGAKRKRTSTAILPAGSEMSRGQGDGATPIPAPSPHAVPDHGVLRTLQEQLNLLQQNMAAITRNATNLQPPVHPNLADSLDAVRQMVDGFNTNNELLRTIIGNQPQPRVGTPAPTGTPPTRPERTDAPMNLDAEFVARAYRETPIKRSLRANALSRLVRKFFKSIYKGEVRAGAAPESATMENFVLQLEAPPGAAFNKAARQLFVRAFLNRDCPEVVAIKPSFKEVEHLFVSNFRTERTNAAWARLSPQDQEERRRRHRRKERQRSMYFRRLGAAKRYAETRRHVPMIQEFGPDGMSEDASDHDNGTGKPIYNILDHAWRSPYATSCFRTLDALHRDNRFRPIRKVSGGAHPHNRILSNMRSTSAPLPFLRASYYDREWLARQPTLVKQELQVQEDVGGPYNFSHDPYIVELATTNNGHLDSIWAYN